MSDLEKFIELYISFGIELGEYNENARHRMGIQREQDNNETYVYLEVDGHKMLDGYGGFYSVVTFNTDGSFKAQEFYE